MLIAPTLLIGVVMNLLFPANGRSGGFPSADIMLVSLLKSYRSSRLFGSDFAFNKNSSF
jgi:hypothetical protein